MRQAAAAALGVNDRTVGYRLGSIEKRVRHPISARRDEMAVALRLAAHVLARSAARDGVRSTI